jgi:hypothetical protein
MTRRTIQCAIAITAAFALIVFLTAWWLTVIPYAVAVIAGVVSTIAGPALYMW